MCFYVSVYVSLTICLYVSLPMCLCLLHSLLASVFFPAFVFSDPFRWVFCWWASLIKGHVLCIIADCLSVKQTAEAPVFLTCLTSCPQCPYLLLLLLFFLLPPIRAHSSSTVCPSFRWVLRPLLVSMMPSLLNPIQQTIAFIKLFFLIH